MKTYNQLLHEHKLRFYEAGIMPDVIKAYLFELCQERNIDLFTNLDNEADMQLIAIFEEGIERLLNNEPMNHVLGYSWFYGYKFITNQDVLIPRYETEELVGNILSKIDSYFSDRDRIELADVGTGSGAIAIALKKEDDRLKVTATDISIEALEVARENARRNEADIEFMQGNMLDPLIEHECRLDILVSNPPYIPQDEVLERSVIDFEPHVALFGGNDGLFFYEEIFKGARKVLKDDGLLAFEIGYDQKTVLMAKAAAYFPAADIQVLKDINGKDRMLFIKL